MNNILDGKALFIDFDSTFVKVETIDELAKVLGNNLALLISLTK